MLVLGRKSSGAVKRTFDALYTKIDGQAKQLNDAQFLLGNYAEHIESCGFHPADSTNLYVVLKNNSNFDKFYLYISNYKIQLLEDAQSDWRNDRQIFSYSRDNFAEAQVAFQNWVNEYGINVFWRVKEGFVEERRLEVHEGYKNYYSWTKVCSVARLNELAEAIHVGLQSALPFAGIKVGVELQ